MGKINKSGKIRYSVQFKFSLAFFLLIAVLLTFLNTYPIIATRDMVAAAKKESMTNQASTMSSSLSALNRLTTESTTQVVELLGVSAYSRVIVTDDEGMILYDSSQVNPCVGKYALFSEIYSALEGKKAFYSRYEDDAFMTRVALPVRNSGVIIGAVYLYEYDSDQSALISSIKEQLLGISCIVGVLALAAVLVFSQSLRRRLMELVNAMHTVAGGDFNYRMEVKGHDELSELTNEFNNLVARLDNTEEMRRRFVSDASHELKTPLAAIRLLSDSIVQSGGMDMDTVLEFVTDIGNEADRLQRITEKLLSLTRLENAKQPKSGAVDIKTVAGRTLRLLEQLAKKKSVSLEYKLSEGCIVLGSEDILYQIIFNLVENGIKYNVKDGLVRLLTYVKGENVIIIVDDTGIGIPEKDMPEIFGRFYRVDKARSRDAGGSGLGLSIVHDAVVKYGGNITVEGRKPQGTRFTVTFPLYHGDADSGEEGEDGK